MLRHPRTPDPDGYYASLGVDPVATHSEIASAFRAKAHVLHPDVPRTGNAAAFMLLRQAYDVLSHPDRRAEYDRKADAVPVIEETFEEPDLDDPIVVYPAEYRPSPPPAEPMAPRMPQFDGLPVVLWLVVGVVLGFGSFEAVRHLRRPERQPEANIRPNAPVVAPLAPSAHRAELYGQPPVHLAGTPNFYVTPSQDPAVLWKRNPGINTLTRMAELPPFSTVQATRQEPGSDLVDVLVTGGFIGFIGAGHLTPGDALAARRAYCAYNAGLTPENGELLEQRNPGTGELTLDNQALQPAVVKLRDASGAVALSVFLSPDGHSDLHAAPSGSFQMEFAIGELWSRACNGFATGGQTGRMDALIELPGNNHIVVKPESSQPAWTPISEPVFERE